MYEIKNETQKRHLRCPHCKSDDLAFVTEYHCAHVLRFFEVLCTVYLVILIFVNLGNLIPWSLGEINKSPSYTSTQTINISPPTYTTSDQEEEKIEPITIALVVLAIALGIFKLARHYVESKTHVQAICRTCGNLWLLN